MKPTFTRLIALLILMFILCSANSANAQSAAPHAKINLAGAWKTKAGDEQYILNPNGTSLCSYKGRECPGTWAVSGSRLIVNPKKLMWRKKDPCSETRTFEIVNHTVNMLTITETSTKRTIQLENQE